MGLPPLAELAWRVQPEYEEHEHPRAPRGDEGAGRWIEKPDIRARVDSPSGNSGAKPVRPFSPAGRQRFDAVSPGYRQATEEELLGQIGKSRLWAGMWKAEDAGHHNPIILFKASGETKRLYTPEHHQEAERAKWARVERFRPHRERVRNALRDRAAAGDDAALSLLLSMETGMRPSSPSATSRTKDPKTGQPIATKTYGASNLLRKHVVRRNGDGSVTLDFIGKSGVRNLIRVQDPELATMLWERKQGGPPNEQLLPGSSEGKMDSLFKSLAGDEFKVKDLRTLWANTIAPAIFAALVAKAGRPPRDAAEFAKWIEIAAEKAAERLGNEKATFLENYLSMLPFQRWMADESWWRWGKRNLAGLS
jgi:hypothetical protein